MAVSADARAPTSFRIEVARRLPGAFTALAAGGLGGIIVGGVGGRLVMFILRLTSPDVVIGADSDDGFEIGRNSFATLNLFAATMALGAASGVACWSFRSILPGRRWRIGTWSAFSGTLGGAGLVRNDGIDFAVLEPRAFAVIAFIAIPRRAAG